MKTAAVIVAAGRGSRAAAVLGGPKQYAHIGRETVLTRTIRAFSTHPRIDFVQVVIHADDAPAYRASWPDTRLPVLPPVIGGATRQSSGLRGLEALGSHGVTAVLIHDAARPFVDHGTIDRVLAALDEFQGAVPGLKVADTLKRVGPGGAIAGTVDREHLWRAQTPQAFHFAAVLAAHQQAAAAGRHDFTDDAALAEWAGLSVTVVEGREENRKITTPEDLAMAERTVAERTVAERTVAERTVADREVPDIRTGTGFDVHRFAAGDHVWLGGIRIPHVARLEGHSDADVALHALTDALLGAIGDGDIGQHFPPSDMRWQGAASRLFLEDAARRVRTRGGRINNVDLTILCEAPRIGPHRDAMRTAIAAILGIDIDRVGVKATTTEGLGFTGRREGIAAMATATVVLVG